MRITIYEDPCTRQRPEGEATFIRELSDSHDPDPLRRCVVRFDGHGEPEVERKVHYRDLQDARLEWGAP